MNTKSEITRSLSECFVCSIDSQNRNSVRLVRKSNVNS